MFDCQSRLTFNVMWWPEDITGDVTGTRLCHPGLDNPLWPADPGHLWSVCVCVCGNAHLFMYVFIRSSICLSIYSSICLFNYSSIYLSIYRSICLFIYFIIFSSIDLSLHLFIYLSIHPNTLNDLMCILSVAIVASSSCPCRRAEELTQHEWCGVALISSQCVRAAITATKNSKESKKEQYGKKNDKESSPASRTPRKRNALDLALADVAVAASSSTGAAASLTSLTASSCITDPDTSPANSHEYDPLTANTWTLP